MKLNNIKKVVVCMVAAVACMAGSVNAQQATQQQGSGAPQTRVAPVVAPPGVGTPRLGFMGQMIYGYGMRVIGTNYGSPAQMAGLEGGDVIFYIGGQRILSQYDYNMALQNAATYNGGFVTMVVRNVRYDMGLTYQEFVTVSTRMPGYTMPVPGGGPVVAYGAQGGQSGMAMRSSTRQGGQSQDGRARKKIKELKPSEAPKMRSGEKGTSQ